MTSPRPKPPAEPKYTVEYVYEYDEHTEGTPGPGAYEPNHVARNTARQSNFAPPSYSMRGRFVESKAIANPGPGTYDLGTTVGKGGPKSSLHARLSGNTGATDEPGPGAYDHHPNFGRPEVNYSFRPNLHPKQENEDLPGPAAYYPRDTLGDAPAMMLKGKLPPTPNPQHKTPGPGAHDPSTNNMMGKGQKKTLGYAIDVPTYNENVPGPGNYDHERANYVKPSGAKPSFGRRLDEQGGKVKNTVPGPGTYSPRRIREPVSKSFGPSAPSVTMAKRFVDSSTIATPGPGTYTSRDSIGQGGPSTSLHSKARPSSFDVDQPGPGAYDNHPNFGRPQNAKTFRPRTKTEEEMKRKMNQTLPGPSYYNVPSPLCQNAVSTTLKSRIPGVHNKPRAPGPGAYDHEKQSFVGRGKKTTWNLNSGRKGLVHNGVPGPGAHNGMINQHRFKQVKPAAPKFSFGASKTPRFTQRGPRRRAVRVMAQTARG